MNDIFQVLAAGQFHDADLSQCATVHAIEPGHGNGADHGLAGWLMAVPHGGGEKHPHELNLELFEEEGADHHG